MDGFSFTDPTFFVTLILGGIFFCAISFAFTQFESKDGSIRINKKGLLRDTLLGVIFTTMAWNIIPESMKSLGDSIKNTFTSSTTASTTSMKHGDSIPSSADIDLQVGPASF